VEKEKWSKIEKMKVGKVLRPAGLLLLVMGTAGVGLYFFSGQAIQWPSYLAMSFFYALVFGLGAYAATKVHSAQAEGILVAGRAIPLWMAAGTMGATWVDGGYINGTAEYAASAGLMWVQAPWGYALSLVVGGLFFAKPMRRRKFLTMLDPLARRFGNRLTAVLFLPALAGEVFWTAAILTALGTTFSAVIGLDMRSAILLSAGITLAYTALGGLWAVAMTDVVQLGLLLVGLYIVAPIALQTAGGWSEVWPAYVAKHGAGASFLPDADHLGAYYWTWWDGALLLIFGGVPWQVYFQRVLSAKSPESARWLSLLAAGICLLAAAPAVLIGITGSVVDWQAHGVGAPAVPAATLPWVIRYLTNPWVATIGLGAVAAAVMSSVDSSILSASSMAGWNIYRPWRKPQISGQELNQVIRRMIWIIGIAATLLALNIRSVYQLWFLCSDFVYCLLFPALVSALFDPKANTAGVLAGFLVAFILRFGGGDAVLGIPVRLPYPLLEDGTVAFPFRTLAMGAGLVSIFIISRLTQRWVPPVPLDPA